MKEAIGAMNMKEKEKFQKYRDNGQRTNIAIIATKIDFMYDDMKVVKNDLKEQRAQLSIVKSIRTRSKMNTGLIMVIVVALIGLGVTLIGG